MENYFMNCTDWVLKSVIFVPSCAVFIEDSTLLTQVRGGPLIVFLFLCVAQNKFLHKREFTCKSLGTVKLKPR
jgi:hypothetical protein